MQFKYFKGSLEDMSDLVGGKAICSICGLEDQCFDLKLNVFTPAEFDEIAKHTEPLN
jgi:hypothetical protein